MDEIYPMFCHWSLRSAAMFHLATWMFSSTQKTIWRLLSVAFSWTVTLVPGGARGGMVNRSPHMYWRFGTNGHRVRRPLLSKMALHILDCSPIGNGTTKVPTRARMPTRTCCERWVLANRTWIWAGWLRWTVQYASLSASQLAMRMARGAGAPSAGRILLELDWVAHAWTFLFADRNELFATLLPGTSIDGGRYRQQH